MLDGIISYYNKAENVFNEDFNDAFLLKTKKEFDELLKKKLDNLVKNWGAILDENLKEVRYDLQRKIYWLWDQYRKYRGMRPLPELTRLCPTVNSYVYINSNSFYDTVTNILEIISKVNVPNLVWTVVEHKIQ